MNCPLCITTQLVMTDRQGIEIDYCPQCRGVWLDRGELDKIIDRSAPSAAAPIAEARREMPSAREALPARDTSSAQWGAPTTYAPNAPKPRRDYDDDDDDHRYHGGHKRKKRGGFLGELFDFD